MIMQETIGEEIVKVHIDTNVKTKLITYSLSSFVYHKILLEQLDFSKDFTISNIVYKSITLNLN